MPKRYSSTEIISVLLAHGFEERGQTGSHKKFRKGDRVVVIPHPRKIIPVGTFSSILRQSGLNMSEFEKRH
ncbi:type II toxin-antitoxin system HicA family toxin [Syntrophus gentianae]|uniref:type II toxin-antitoxin system HicA family toxin n=1 Tax=Syntrophus gentianae TaxID=43775 RepID=UPI000B8246E4